MNEADQQNHCSDDEELAVMLHKLFVVEGHEEVVIQHPEDGERVVTKKEYLELQDNLNKARNMSPAERIVESKRIRNIKQKQFRDAMLIAECYVIDLDDEDSFGLDINGTKIDIEGMDFVPVKDYISGIEKKENEIGCYASESLHKPPVRLLTEDSKKIH